MRCSGGGPLGGLTACPSGGGAAGGAGPWGGSPLAHPVGDRQRDHGAHGRGGGRQEPGGGGGRHVLLDRGVGVGGQPEALGRLAEEEERAQASRELVLSAVAG